MKIRQALGLVLGSVLALGVMAPVAAFAETHVVEMLNRDPDDSKKRNIFTPAVLVVQPGDTIQFVSTDRGHNAQSIDGMLPEGAEEFKSPLSKDYEITLDTPGVYGYKCTPHYALGMVGLIVVEGEGWDANLEAAKEVRHRGKKAGEGFEALFVQLDEMMAEKATN